MSVPCEQIPKFQCHIVHQYNQMHLGIPLQCFLTYLSRQSPFQRPFSFIIQLETAKMLKLVRRYLGDWEKKMTCAQFFSV